MPKLKTILTIGKHFGWTMVLKMATMSILVSLNLSWIIPVDIRWSWGNEFQWKWKRMILTEKGYDRYCTIADQTSRHILEEFYEVGTDFSGRVVVDVGCGVRGVLPVISAKKKVGIDPIIKEFVGKVEFPDGEYISARGEDIPLPHDYADVVVCNNTLNHVENSGMVLGEILRILKPGGILLLLVYIQPEGIDHLVSYTKEDIEQLVLSFHCISSKYDRVPIIEAPLVEYEGELPMRYGGVYRK